MTPIPKVIDAFHGDKISSFADIYAAGCLGAILKATEGSTFADPAYVRRRGQVADTPLQLGAYHFARPGDLVGQAHFFLDTAKPLASTRLALDLEVPGISIDDAIDWCQEIEAAVPILPWFYSYSYFLQEWLREPTADQVAYLSRLPLWLADYNAAPKWPRNVWPQYLLWQFTNKGQMAGTSRGVDLNAFDGTDADLLAQWRGAR